MNTHKNKNKYLVGRIFDNLDRNIHILFPIPSLLITCLLIIFPLIFTIYSSLHIWDSRMQTSYVGLLNFERLITEGEIIYPILLTLYFIGLGLFCQMSLGLGLALLLNRDFRGANFIRTTFLLPMISTPIVISLIWMIMFNPSIGVLNYLLGLIGIPPCLWVASVNLVIPSLVLVDTWQWTPFVSLILLAGLRSLPVEPFESAIVDGANGWQILWRITLPLLRPIIFSALIFRTIDIIKVFETIFVITAGGPGNASTTLAIYAFKRAFKYFDLGYGSATILFFLIFVTILCISLMIIRKKLESDI